MRYISEKKGKSFLRLQGSTCFCNFDMLFIMTARLEKAYVLTDAQSVVDNGMISDL